MSTMFRLKYLLGMIPSARKIDAEWAKIFKIKGDLQTLESSGEITRYNELNTLLNSFEFKLQKQEILDLKFTDSSEHQLLEELKQLEKSPAIKQYFSLLNSSELERFRKIESGSALRRFHELKEEVGSREFQQRKQDIESLDYNNSSEYQLYREFKTLSDDRRLKDYNKSIQSEDYLLFKEYQAKTGHQQVDNPETKELKRIQNFLKSSHFSNIQYVEKHGLAERLNQLKEQVNSPAFTEREKFLKNKDRYKTTKDYPVYLEYIRLSRDKNILFYLKFDNSSRYKNFLETKNSYNLERLLELRKMSADSEFQQKVAWLKNKNRYQITALYRQEMEFRKLEKSNAMKRYRKLQKAPELRFFEKWKIVFEETFETNSLDRKRWMPENYWGFRHSGKSFSQAGEAHCYNGEKNLALNNNSLSILTKKEHADGQIWSSSAGLVPKRFDYTSGIINSAESFRFSEGAVEAKVRFTPSESLTSAFSLTGSRPMPQIDIFRSGKNYVGFGYSESAQNGAVKNYKQIHGLNFNKYHVFRLEKFDHTLTWKINGVTVHSQRYTGPVDEYFLNFVSSLHEPVNSKAVPHQFQIDWVRCYRKN